MTLNDVKILNSYSKQYNKFIDLFVNMANAENFKNVNEFNAMLIDEIEHFQKAKQDFDYLLNKLNSVKAEFDKRYLTLVNKGVDFKARGLDIELNIYKEQIAILNKIRQESK